MYAAQRVPLNDQYQEDVVERDLYAGQRIGTATEGSGFKNDQFASNRPSIGKRIFRTLTRFFITVLIGVGAALAWQSNSDEAIELVRTWAPSLGWLLPVSTIKSPAPAVTSAEFQLQLKPMALDVAIVRRSIEHLAANQEQLARKQEQLDQNIATLQAVEQDVRQKISSPPPSRAGHIPPRTPPQPAAESVVVQSSSVSPAPPLAGQLLR